MQLNQDDAGFWVGAILFIAAVLSLLIGYHVCAWLDDRKKHPKRLKMK